MLNYAGKLKMVEEAHENNPYEQLEDTVYKIEKTQASSASRAVRRSPSVEDVPESSRSRPRKEKKMEKFGRWIKAIFTTCTYAARTAYED